MNFERLKIIINHLNGQGFLNVTLRRQSRHIEGVKITPFVIFSTSPPVKHVFIQ
jgi:hypothetical protein